MSKTIHPGVVVDVQIKIPVFDDKKRDHYIRTEHRFLWTKEAYEKWKSEQPARPTFSRFTRNREDDGPSFEPIKEQRVENLMIEHKTPIVIRSIEDFSKYYTINGNLGRIDFQKVMPPAQAYQELSMFLGNLAPENKPMVQIDDKYKIQEHGFDKWSFRKQGKNSV